MPSELDPRFLLSVLLRRFPVFLLTAVVIFSGFAAAAVLIPSRAAEDLFAGWWQLLAALGAVPRVLVWDGEGAVGRWRGGRSELTAECQGFRGTLAAKVLICRPADPEAKGLVERLSLQAYDAREQMAVLSFGNGGVTPVLLRRRAPKALRERLDAADGGGGTPLRDAVLRAARLIRQWRRQDPGLHVRTYLITDGRTRQSLDGLPPLGDCIVVDTEQAAVKRGRGTQIARQLGALYRPLSHLERRLEAT